jgi:hypothetical protein
MADYNHVYLYFALKRILVDSKKIHYQQLCNKVYKSYRLKGKKEFNQRGYF